MLRTISFADIDFIDRVVQSCRNKEQYEIAVKWAENVLLRGVIITGREKNEEKNISHIKK